MGVMNIFDNLDSIFTNKPSDLIKNLKNKN